MGYYITNLEGEGSPYDPASGPIFAGGSIPAGWKIYETGGNADSGSDWMRLMDPNEYPSFMLHQEDPSLRWGEPGSLGYSLSRYAGVPDYYMAKNMQMIQDAAPNVAPNFDWTQAVQNMSAKQAAQFGGLNDADFNDGQLPAKLFEMIPGGATAMQNLQQLPSFQNAQAWGAERWAASQEDDGLLSGLLEPIQDVARFTKEGLQEGYLLPIAAFAAPAILGGLGSLGAGATGTGEALAAGASGSATGAGGLSSFINPSTAASGAVRGALTSAALGGDPITGALTGGITGGFNLPSSLTSGIPSGIVNLGTSAIKQLISTGDIDPTRLLTSAALGYVDPQIADALKGIVPSQAMPAVISLANQALTGQDLNLAAAGASALGASVSPGIDSAVRDAIRSTYQYKAEETPSVGSTAPNFTATVVPDEPVMPAAVEPIGGIQQGLPAVETTPQTPVDTNQNSFDTGEMQRILGIPAAETTIQTPVNTDQNTVDSTGGLTQEAIDSWEPQLPAGTNVSIDDSGSYVVTDQDGNLISTTESQPDRYTTVQQDNGTKTVVDTYTGDVVDRIGYTDGPNPYAKTLSQAIEDDDRAMLGDDPVQVYRDLGLIDPDATDLSAFDKTKAYLPDGGVIDADQLPAYTAITTTTSKPATTSSTPRFGSTISSALQKGADVFGSGSTASGRPSFAQSGVVRTGGSPQVMPLWQGFVDQLQKRGYAMGGMVDHPIEHVPGPEDRMYMKHHTQGFAVGGPGTGQSDDIPTMLSDGEYVIDADTVSALGDGSSKAGAEVLDKFRQEIRKHKRVAPLSDIPPKAKSPLAYLKAAQKGKNHG